MVEFALVLPILFALLLGIVDFGLIMGDQISMRDGARDGARHAVVNDKTTSCGAGTFTANQELLCFTKDHIGVDNVAVYVKVAGPPATPTVGQAVVVCAATPMVSASGFFTATMRGRYLRSYTSMRVEQTSTLESGGDTDPSGDKWSWC